MESEHSLRAALEAVRSNPKLRLAKENEHCRDDRVVLLEDIHRYVIDNNPELHCKSSTWLKEQLFPKYDAEKSFRLSDKYVGQDAEKVFRQWKQTGIESANNGRHWHRVIELKLNGPWEDLLEELEKFKRGELSISRELQLFYMWFDKWGKTMRPMRTEMTVFIKNLRFAGQLDALFRDANGDVVLVDWKCTKDLTREFCWCFRVKSKEDTRAHVEGCERFGIHPTTQHITATKLNKFFVQLNLYSFVLKHLYAIDVKRMLVVCFHADQAEPLQYEAPFWPEVAEGALRWLANENNLPYDISD